MNVATVDQIHSSYAIIVFMDSLRREGLHEQITKRIGQGILRGELAEGEVTSELALCKSLGVSRTVLRESIKVLVSKGLLEVRPKVGLRVLPRAEWNLFDPDVLTWQSDAALALDEEFVRTLCEVRLIVETAAAGLAASRAKPEQRALIAECFRNMELHVDDKPTYDDADGAFHGAIFDASHNALLKQLGKTIRAALRKQGRSGSNSEVGNSMELHRNVKDSICRGDAHAACVAMENVIVHAARAFYRMAEPEISSGREGKPDPEHDSALKSARNLLMQLQQALDGYRDSGINASEKLAGAAEPVLEKVTSEAS
jgi:GntR family galactonate operon transcriptional repressor